MNLRSGLAGSVAMALRRPILGVALTLLAGCADGSLASERPYWRTPPSNELNGPRHPVPADAFRADATTPVLSSFSTWLSAARRHT